MFSLVTSRVIIEALIPGKATVTRSYVIVYLSGKTPKSTLSQKGTGAKGYNMRHRSLCTGDEATISCTIDLKSFTQDMTKTKTFGLQQTSLSCIIALRIVKCEAIITFTDSQKTTTSITAIIANQQSHHRN